MRGMYKKGSTQKEGKKTVVTGLVSKSPNSSGLKKGGGRKMEYGKKGKRF